MLRSPCLALLACLGLPPAAGAAEGLTYLGLGFDLSHVDSAPAQGGIVAFGQAEMRFGDRVGLQGDLAVEYLGSEEESQGAASLALHPHLRLGHGFAFGAYLQARGSADPATAAGLELAWKPRNGFTAEMYFGQTWGDELEEGGNATNKGATLGYSFANNVYTTLFFSKDTTSESGRPDRDYYDYGVGAEVPLSTAGDTRLTATFGQIRFDAEGGPVTKFSLGLSKQLGGAQQRSTFTRRRSVLTELAGY